MSVPEAFDDRNFSPLMVKHMEPLDHEGDTEAEEAESALKHAAGNTISPVEKLSTQERHQISCRLRPTLAFSDHSISPQASPNQKNKGLGLSNEHHFKLFGHHPSFSAQGNGVSHNNHNDEEISIRKDSTDAINVVPKSQYNPERSSMSLPLSAQSEHSKRFGLHRHNSHSKDQNGNHTPKFGHKDKSKDNKKDSKTDGKDDLSQMLSRASNFMTLASVRLNSFVICLSYKGKDSRNIEDLHDFVFRMPVLEYRNKTWSNLDLALRLKKDVIKALISHTGAILGNKLGHHRPTRIQQGRLRELAEKSALIPNSDTLVNTPSTSDAGSISHSTSTTPNGERSRSPGPARPSFTSSTHTDSKNGTNGHGPSSHLQHFDGLMRSDSFTSMQSANNSKLSSKPLSHQRPATSSPEHTANARFGSQGNHLQSTFSRHLSSAGDLMRGRGRSASQDSKGLPGGKDGEGEDTEGEEGHRKKRVLLLGKKILKALD